MGDVIKFPGGDKVQQTLAGPEQVIPPDKVLDGAIGSLQEVLVLGFDTEGVFYFAASHADGGNAMWLMEVAKSMLLTGGEPDEGY